MLTAQQIRAELPGTAMVLAADASYAQPRLDWLQGEFWDWFQNARWRLGLDKWDRRHDCDDFARAYAQSCADAWALTPGAQAEAVAVGEFWYHGTNGPHAINLALTDKGAAFIEPQTGQTVALTQKEISTCFFARF